MIVMDVVKKASPQTIQGTDAISAHGGPAGPIDISVLPAEVLGHVFSFIAPYEGNRICRVSKKWELSWKRYRYQEMICNLRACKELVDGKKLFECIDEFSPDTAGRAGSRMLDSNSGPSGRNELATTSSNASHHPEYIVLGRATNRVVPAANRDREEDVSAEYFQLAKGARRIRSAVRAALAYLPPEERSEIETLSADSPPPQKLSWAWFTSFLPWIFGANEPARMKRELWQIAENPVILKLLFEKAFHNRTLFHFFGWKVGGDDNPPWKKVNKIREWLSRPALKMQFYIYLDKGLKRIPTEIGTCINVEAINLSNNQIAFLPSQMGALSKLQSLSLGGNRLTSFLEDCSSLKELRALYLENNLLQTLPEGMSQLNIQTLDISFNPMTTFPRVLGEIQSLRFLRLSEEQKARFRAELADLRKMNPQLRVY